jgi:hypothetical protein
VDACDFGGGDVCPDFWVEGADDALDCVCFCDGAFERQSIGPANLQGPRFSHR